MPDYATLNATVRCPECGTALLDRVRFQWGMVPRMGYRVGDAVEWLRDSTGQVHPSFEIHGSPGGRLHWNGGDQGVTHAILFDALFDDDIRSAGLKCPTCGIAVAAVVLDVIKGVLGEPRILDDANVDAMLGRSRGKANIIVVDVDGTLCPREDWFDHPLVFVPPTRETERGHQ